MIHHGDRSLPAAGAIVPGSPAGPGRSRPAWTCYFVEPLFYGVMAHARLLLFCLGVIALLAGCERAAAAEIAGGKALAEGCAGCHGADGVSQTALTPSLAGQPDDFIQWQLVYFRGGSRKNEVMGPHRRGSEQRGYPESRRLLRIASAAKAGGRHRQRCSRGNR